MKIKKKSLLGKLREALISRPASYVTSSILEASQQQYMNSSSLSAYSYSDDVSRSVVQSQQERTLRYYIPPQIVRNVANFVHVSIAEAYLMTRGVMHDLGSNATYHDALFEISKQFTRSAIPNRNALRNALRELTDLGFQQGGILPIPSTSESVSTRTSTFLNPNANILDLTLTPSEKVQAYQNLLKSPNLLGLSGEHILNRLQLDSQYLPIALTNEVTQRLSEQIIKNELKLSDTNPKDKKDEELLVFVDI